MSQSSFASLAGVSQGTVSRWERGLLDPSRGQLAKIRLAAKDRDLSLNDSWFFDLEQRKEGEMA